MMVQNCLLSANKPCLVTPKAFIICWYQLSWDKYFLKSISFCLTKSIFTSRFQVCNMRCCFGNHKCETTEPTVGCTPVPARSLWEGKQIWILPQEINQRCCCPPRCKLFIFSPEFSAVLLFFTAVNYLDTAPVESPYYFVMEKKELCRREIYNEWTGISSSNCK